MSPLRAPEVAPVPRAAFPRWGHPIPSVERVLHIDGFGVEQIVGVAADGKVWMPGNVDGGSYNGTVLVWDPATDEVVQGFVDPEGYYFGAACYVPDTGRMYIGGVKGTGGGGPGSTSRLHVFELDNPHEPVETIHGTDGPYPYGMVWHPGEHVLYTGGGAPLGNFTFDPETNAYTAMSAGVAPGVTANSWSAAGLPSPGPMPDGTLWGSGQTLTTDGLVIVRNGTITFYTGDHDPHLGHPAWAGYSPLRDKAVVVALAPARVLLCDMDAPNTDIELAAGAGALSDFVYWTAVLHPKTGLLYVQSNSVPGAFGVASLVGNMRWVAAVHSSSTIGPYGCIWHPGIERVIATQYAFDGRGTDIVVLT